MEARACRVHFSEGRACRVRRATFDNPSRFNGHDKHAPPNYRSEGRACRVRVLEGPACRVRGAMFDNPSRLGGSNKRGPPKGWCGKEPGFHLREMLMLGCFSVSHRPATLLMALPRLCMSSPHLGAVFTLDLTPMNDP